MLNLGEWLSGQMAEFGVTEEDVISAAPRSVYDSSELGNYLTFEDLQQSFEGKPENAEIHVVDESIVLVWERLEYIWETAKRLVDEAKRSRFQEERDRAEFERLNAKFGKE